MSIIAILFSAHVMHDMFRHMRHEHSSHYKPNEQLLSLESLTEHALMLSQSAMPSPTIIANNGGGGHASRHPKGKINVVKDEKHHSDNNSNSNNNMEDNIFRCTSQVMIMRHCDKRKVHINKHGEVTKIFNTDTRDEDGDRHCSAKGKDRSEYIATLFIDPTNYNELVSEAKPVSDGVPPVTFIKSNGFEGKVSSPAAKKKPQFPTPLKLYALSSGRPNVKKPHKEHDNYREIETITPLSEKFGLDVDERYGVDEEGELATDFFSALSDSVTENVHSMKLGGGMLKSSHSHAEGGGSKDMTSSQLCNSGMTVINWKHSRIPILARALGCGKSEGCPKKYKGHDFDTMWLLTFQYSLSLDDYDSADDELDEDVDASFLDLESLSKVSELGSNKGRNLRREKQHHHRGTWKITATLVNEGFEPVLKDDF